MIARQPSLNIDLFSDEAIADPYPLYRQIRDAGPAVWLEQYDAFDVERNPNDHVAYGWGVHRCAGAHLANLEMEVLLDALVRKVDAIEVADPVPFPSNMLAGYASFPASFSKARP